MKAKVLSRNQGKLKILLENGRIFVIEPDVAKWFNPMLRAGDTGEMYMDNERGRMRFTIDAVENDLTPKPILPITKE